MTIIIVVLVLAAVLVFLKTGNPFKAIRVSLGLIVTPIVCGVLGLILGFIIPAFSPLTGFGVGFFAGFLLAFSKI